ncbi:5-beta-cholestane-3-alpha,7-alpha-diol 12-alpha-hydroxylase-like [Scyliorhinus torazame]|uniref:5-beta-cholestane-3-alpha,7-alpha-diol 12-alpha-hydroxylase-like n=1 Tax=Scyliorhinus torazame TaxID=75743 RepID=UPI003B5C5060
MAYWLPVLLTLAALLLTLLYFLGALRVRRPGEPPLDSGYLPWLGHVLPFRRNTMQFLQRMQRKHGEIFTVQLGGHYITFLMDPLSYGAVVKESQAKLNFRTFASELVERVFGYQVRVEDQKLLKTTSNKHLMGDSLVELTRAMMGNLQKLMLQSVAQPGQWKEDGLFHFSYNLVFRAGYLTLFGTQPATESDQQEAEDAAWQRDHQQSNHIFGHFRRYDRLFPRLAYAVLTPKQKLEAEKLRKMFWELLSVQKMGNRENISRWISERQQQMAEKGVEQGMQSRYMFVLLWVSQGNTGPAAFWLLLYLISSPKALGAVRAEVDRILRDTGQGAKSGTPPIELTRDMLLRTPVLDSAVDESLRMTAAPMLVRAVLEDTSLQMADGREYWLRKGDRVALFPYLSAHMDPEIHPQPHTFQFDRFLQADGSSRKTDFYKGGKRLKYYNMPWGAGVSMCPGRFFAVNELKQFVFLMLSYFEFELVNPEEEIPPIDCSRWALGTIHPTRDIQFKYRLRF